MSLTGTLYAGGWGIGVHWYVMLEGERQGLGCACRYSENLKRQVGKGKHSIAQGSTYRARNRRKEPETAGPLV